MNPHPSSFGLFPIILCSLVTACAIGGALWAGLHLGRAQGLSVRVLLNQTWILLLAGLLGARGAYVLVNLPAFKSDPAWVLRPWEGGWLFSAGLISALAALVVCARIRGLSFWILGDVWAPATALGLGIGRIADLVAELWDPRTAATQWGRVLPLPEVLSGLDIPLPPMHIFATAAALAIFCVLWRLSARRQMAGQVVLWFLILHSTAQLALDRLREHLSGAPNTMRPTQWISVITLVVAVGILLRRSPRPEIPSRKP